MRARARVCTCIYVSVGGCAQEQPKYALRDVLRPGFPGLVRQLFVFEKLVGGVRARDRRV
jgi:hypothetical protein